MIYAVGTSPCSRRSNPALRDARRFSCYADAYRYARELCRRASNVVFDALDNPKHGRVVALAQYRQVSETACKVVGIWQFDKRGVERLVYLA